MTTKSQPWMIFKPEGAAAFYMWNGRFPIISHVDASAGTNEDWYWNGKFPIDLTKTEKAYLNKIANGKSTSPFEVPGKKGKFTVVSRGKFKPEKVS